MADENDRAGPGPESNGTGIDPTAVALAMAGASREEADSFLRDQRALIAAQLHHLHEQIKHLHLDMWEKRLGVWLRAATFCVGIAAAAGLAYLVWDASRANGLLIEPFSVPADLANRGLTGQAVASQLLDKLTAMQNTTQTIRSPGSYRINWGNDIRVEIPETGISIGEFQRFLREWLGHDTHITGEVWRTANGIAITARSSGSSGDIVTGSEFDFDNLIQKAAENVYRITQPYRYANYLDRNAFRPGAPLRVAEAEAIYKRLIYDPDPLERAYAWNGLANLAWSYHGNEKDSLQYYLKSEENYLKADPNSGGVLQAIAARDQYLGHAEDELAALQNPLRKNTMSAASNLLSDGMQAALLGDFREAVRLYRIGIEQTANNTVYNHDYPWMYGVRVIAELHDGAATREWLRAMPPLEDANRNEGYRAESIFFADVALEHWQAAIAAEPSVESTFASSRLDFNTNVGTGVRPWLALAKAKLGDTAGAQSVIGTTPSNCYDCVRLRGNIAAIGRNWGKADYWFAHAIHDAPSIPFAYDDWGVALLARGQPDAAIAQFKLANQKGPHFADPLEGWGEALMARNQSHLALAKFAEADKYAPNWGRLHLKWAEALFYAGKREEAKAQFARAAQLDLTPDEKSELSKITQSVLTHPA